MRPKSINLFEMLGWGATGLGVLSVLVTMAQALGLRPGPGVATYLLLIFILLLFAALGMATFYAAKRRHELGRWGFIVTAAVIGVLLLTRIDGYGLSGDGMAILYLLLDMLTLAALMGGTICLAQPDAQAWFAQGPIRLPPPVAHPPLPGYGAPPAGGTAYPPVAYPPATGYPPVATPEPAPDLSKAAPPPVAAATQAPAEATRRCPYCAEEIRAEASKCRFCGSAVEPRAL